MLPRFPSEKNEGLARLKNMTRNSSVMKGAILRSWPRNQSRHRAPDSRPAASTAGPLICLATSGSSQQAVLAHRLPGELPDDLAFLHDQDAIGEREHSLRLGRHDDDANPLLAQAAHDLDYVVLGAHVH